MSTTFLNFFTRDPDSKEGQISLQWIKFRLVFHLTRRRNVWIPCGDPIESHTSPPHLDRGPHILWPLERPVEFNTSKGDEAWLFLKIDRNPNIYVETRKRRLVSHITSRSVCIILPNLVYLPEVSVLNRQESGLHWSKWSFERPSPL